MKRNLLNLHALLLVFLLIGGLASCVDDDDFANSNAGNFDALWTIMDERYCFFSLKEQELGVNWQEVRERYRPRVVGANSEQLFEVLAQMLGELRDGHVNLYSGFDIGRNWHWKDDYPENFSSSLCNKYLTNDYRIASGISYRRLDDNIGYMRVPTFSNELSDGGLDNILFHFVDCRALILDVRSNSGGMLTEAERLASRFTNEEVLVGYMQHKTGPGHDDFSSPRPQYLKPSARLRWQKPVYVLTNRAVYSAANEFVKYMKQLPLVTVVGDCTGGGAGMPFSAELPNGWAVRFSACPMYDADGNSTEQGVQPDIRIDQAPEDLLRDIDTIIETARNQIKKI